LLLYHKVSFFVSFFGFFVMPTGHTDGPILTNCASYDVFLLKDVPFLGKIKKALLYLSSGLTNLRKIWFNDAERVFYPHKLLKIPNF